MTKKGLGKGLGALISIYSDEGENESEAVPTAVPKESPTAQGEVNVQSDTNTIEIDIDLIDNNIHQPRKNFDTEKLQELADSIKANGIFQPVLLSRVGKRYMIVAGERRWRAAKLAGLTKVPAIVGDYSAAQVAEIAIVENLQRADLNEIELARGINRLISDFKLTQEQAATRLGKSRSSIANTLRLLSLPDEVIVLIENNKLTAGHAKCLAALPNKELIIKLANLCAEQQLSVRALENLIQQHNNLSGGKPVPKQSIELKELARILKSSLGTKVVIQGNDDKGKIVIDYYNSDDLHRITSDLFNSKKMFHVEQKKSL